MGSSVGLGVIGAADGSGVGNGVGWSVGCTVGIGVGSSVGLGVGAEDAVALDMVHTTGSAAIPV